MRGLRICYFFILTLIAVEGKNNLIQCYVCEDCDVFNDCLLQYCHHGAVVPTTVPSHTPTTPATSTLQTTTAHTTKRTTTPSPHTSTSVIPSTSQAPTKSTTPAQVTTAVASPTEAGTIFTSETEETPDSTTSSLPSTDTEPTSSSLSTDAQTQATTQLRLARNISLAALDTSVSYHCYSIDVVENYKQKTKRGCVEVLEDQSACGVLRKVYGCSSKNCKVCSTDGCNCNGALRSSLFAVAVIMLCGIFSKTISCDSC